jgi:hypothetical protein
MPVSWCVIKKGNMIYSKYSQANLPEVICLYVLPKGELPGNKI